MFKKVLLIKLVFLLAITTPSWATLEMDLGTVVISASRIEQEGQRVAGNVTVITSKQIAESNAQSVPDLLNQVEGAYVYDFSTSKTSTVDIRGFGDTAGRNVLVMVDGRRLNTADSGASDLVQIPIGAVERIEIVRGAASVLYGDNAVGGAINIITKKGKGDISGKLGVVYDSYGSLSEDFNALGKYKKLSYSIYARKSDKKGYRDNADEEYKNFNARFDYDLNEKISFGLQYGFHEDFYQIPGGLNATELNNLGRRGSADSGDLADTEDQYARFTMSIDPLPEDIYFGHLVVEATWRDREVFDTFASFNFNTNREIETTGITVKYIFDRTILDRKVDFVTGLDYYEHENTIIGSGSNSDDLTISKTEKGVFTNLQFETLDDLFFIGGARYHTAKYSFNQRGSSPSFTEERPQDFVTSGGFKYEYAKGSNVHFNYQQTFRFLTTNEWYSSFSGLNTDLVQQKGEQWEIGVKHNHENKMVLTVTPYWLETDNEIFFDPRNGFFGSNSNYDKIRRIGVELGGRFDIKEFFEDLPFFDKLEYFANYTYQNPEFQEGSNDGRKVPFVPSHQANTGIVAKFLDFYNVSLLGRYVGSRYAINDTGNTLARAKPYYVTDLKIAYERKNYEVYMAVNNLFDQKYTTYHATNSSLTTRDVFPAPEKNFAWGMNFKF